MTVIFHKKKSILKSIIMFLPCFTFWSKFYLKSYSCFLLLLTQLVKLSSALKNDQTLKRITYVLIDLNLKMRGPITVRCNLESEETLPF